MPVTEIVTFASEYRSTPAADVAAQEQRPRPCVHRDICRSLVCQLNRNNTDCPDSRKGN
jgi:hypothetical protein